MAENLSLFTAHEADARSLRKVRCVLAVFIAGLVVSGVTAFPLLHELDFVVRVFGLEQAAAHGGLFSSLAGWILKVRDGLSDTYKNYPFIAYGTDWLAFGHLVIALFFIGPMLDPARNVFILKVGLWGLRLGSPARAHLWTHPGYPDLLAVHRLFFRNQRISLVVVLFATDSQTSAVEPRHNPVGWSINSHGKPNSLPR